MRKWIPAALILIAYAVSFVVSRQMPADVVVDLRALLPFTVDAEPDLIPRFIVAFGLPTLALGLWLLLHEAPVSALGRAAGRLFFPAAPQPPARAEVEYDKFAPSYRLIVIWVVTLMLAFHAAVLAVALAWPVAPGMIVGVVTGVGLIVVGNIMPRLRPNPVAGIRTTRTMGNPQIWARTHRIYGALWLVGGLVVTAIAVAAPRYALMTALLVLMLTSLGGLAIPRALAMSALLSLHQGNG